MMRITIIVILIRMMMRNSMKIVIIMRIMMENSMERVAAPMECH